MARPDEYGIIRPTVAGVLFVCKDPRWWFPNAIIQTGAYGGTTVVSDRLNAYQLDAVDITGPLDRQIMDACQFV